MDVKKIKNHVPLLTLIASIAIFALGLLVLLLPDGIVEALLTLAFGLALFIYGGIRFVQSFGDKKKHEGIVALIVSWGVASVLLFMDFSIDTTAAVTSMIVGAVSLLLGILRAIISINCIINKIPGKIRNGISALLCTAFGLFLLIHPIGNFALLSTVAGFYLIFYAVTMFIDALAAMSQSDLDDNRSKRRVHMATLNIFAAVKPTRLIKQINDQIENGELENGMIVEEKSDSGFDHENIEIMVHLTTQGANKFGHVDIAIGDKIYSYGTYDESKVKFAGFVAQGSMIIVPKIPYLRYCLDYQKKYVIGFGAKMSETQLATVRRKIEETLAVSEKLESEYERAVREGRDGSEYKDSASNIVRDVGGSVYTVKEGFFRRYFGINTNCVRFADWLLSESGIDAISFSGLRTPGSYYNMLDNMFYRKNTRVFRKIYYILSSDIVDIESLASAADETKNKDQIK